MFQSLFETKVKKRSFFTTSFSLREKEYGSDYDDCGKT